MIAEMALAAVAGLVAGLLLGVGLTLQRLGVEWDSSSTPISKSKSFNRPK